jgi:anti-sigma factor RsiW
MGTHPTHLIAAYADGELPRGERDVIAAHLESCAACRRELAVHQGVRAALGREPLPEASPALRRRVAQIGRAPLLREAPAGGRRRKAPRR